MEKNNKTVWSWAVAIIVVILIIVWVVSINKPSETGPITLGYVGCLSGDGASFGETEKNATQMAIDKINTDGGIDGRTVSVVYEDGKCNGKDATTAIQKLINIDKVKIVLGGTSSAETLAMVPIITSNKVLLLSAFASNPQLTGSSPFFFRNSPKDTDVAKLDADVIAAKYKKVAIISENTDYSLGVRKVMSQVFSEKGVAVVSDELYNSSQTDFKTILLKIKEVNPDVLYINPGTSAKMGGVFVRQARQMGINIPIHGNFSLVTPEALQAGGKYMEGLVSSDGTGLVGPGLAVLADYKSKTGKAPVNEYLMGANYDRPFIIKQAIEKVGLNTEKIAEYLRSMTDFSGAVGTYHFDKNGDIVGVGFMSVVIKDGKKVPYNN
jgi:branched-chain amino acid transport system substrate-binding protein